MEQGKTLGQGKGLGYGPKKNLNAVNPVRNSSGALNPAGIILKSNPAAEQRGIISNGVNRFGPWPKDSSGKVKKKEENLC